MHSSPWDEYGPDGLRPAEKLIAADQYPDIDDLHRRIVSRIQRNAEIDHDVLVHYVARVEGLLKRPPGRPRGRKRSPGQELREQSAVLKYWRLRFACTKRDRWAAKRIAGPITPSLSSVSGSTRPDANGSVPSWRSSASRP